MSVNLYHIAILNIKGVNYCSIIKRMIEHGAINLLENVDLSEKLGNIKKLTNSLSHMKMSKETVGFDDIQTGKGKFLLNEKPIF